MQCDGEFSILVVSLTLKSTLTGQVATRSLSCGYAREGGKFSLPSMSGQTRGLLSLWNTGMVGF
jgi:hypothetical protein